MRHFGQTELPAPTAPPMSWDESIRQAAMQKMVVGTELSEAGSREVRTRLMLGRSVSGALSGGLALALVGALLPGVRAAQIAPIGAVVGAAVGTYLGYNKHQQFLEYIREHY